MEIRQGEYRLVFSGSIISIGNGPIKIKLPDDVEGDYTFIINFVQDPKSQDVITKATGIDKFTVQLDFTNFNGVVAAGNEKPFNVGTYKNEPLVLLYRVFDLNGQSKTIIFNFYVRSEN